MKLCKKCFIEKTEDNFSYSKIHQDGKYPWCKNCSKEYRKENKEHSKVVWKEWYIKNRDMELSKHKIYKKENKEKIKKAWKEYYLKNKERESQRTHNWYVDNKDKVFIRWSKWYEENREKVLAYRRKYGKEHLDKGRLYVAKRKSILLNAIPEWVNFDKIKEVYNKAKELEKITGIRYHVDHVVPLQSKNVCGFHVWDNLQILADKLNISKGNKFSYMEV